MAAGFGHLGSCMSCAELVAAAFEIFDFSTDEHVGSDVFVLSKGHAAPVLYAATARSSEPIPYAKAGSRFPAHPNATLTENVHVSTGSVGIGLAIAIGIAGGLTLQGQPGRVVVLAGDGEMQAGMVWEALLNAELRASLPLLFVVDANGYQGGMAVPTNDLVREMVAANVREFHAIDGNDPRGVLDVYREFADEPRLTAVWAETRRGAGVPLIERNPLPMTWRPDREDAEAIAAELRAAVD